MYRADISVAVLARLRMEQFEMALDTDVFPTEQFRFIDTQTHFTEHFLRGIVTEAGLLAMRQYQESTSQVLSK